jgi:hypothetical protein
MKGVPNTNAADRGGLTKALSTKTFVVKHDDVNHMFYIELDNGMEVDALTYISAKNPTMVTCIQARNFFWQEIARAPEFHTFMWARQK